MKHKIKPITNKINRWINHVKDYSKKHNIKYKEALSSPECKSSYKSSNIK